jgi:phosphocarrier protein HPr
METIEVIIQHPAGLHARPASKFVRLASSFPCTIQLSDLTSGGAAVNAKSILGVLSLGVDQGHQIRVEADGERAAEAVAALRELIETNFGEA